MDIKDRIKEKRIERGLTLEELAKAIGTSKQTIHKYESGIVANIPSDKIEAIAKALHTTPAYLMGWAEEHAAPKIQQGYSYTAGGSDDIGQLLDVALGLDDAQLEQLIKYAEFLSQEEK